MHQSTKRRELPRLESRTSLIIQRETRRLGATSQLWKLEHSEKEKQCNYGGRKKNERA